jgi:hypothetical protein
LLIALVIAFAPASRAGSLFEVTMSPSTGSGGSVTARGNDLTALLDDAILGRRQFANFAAGGNYLITVNYGGTANALALTFTSVSNVYTIASKAGFTSTSSNRASLVSAVDGALKRRPDDLGFNPAAHSLISVNDGNPEATTALMGKESFDTYAMLPSPTRDEREGSTMRIASMQPGQSSADVSADVGRIRVRSFDGTSYTLPISYRRQLTDRVGMAVGIPVNYTEIEGAQIYRGGLGLGFPVRLLMPGTNQPWFWQVALSGSGVAAVSDDMVEGAWVVQGAFNNALSYDLPACTLSMGNHLSVYGSESFHGYDSKVSQQITKNGLKVGVPIGRGWVVETWGIHNYFVQDAAVRNYFSVGGTLAYRRGPKGNLGWNRPTAYLSFYTEISDHYVTSHLRLGSQWKF